MNIALRQITLMTLLTLGIWAAPIAAEETAIDRFLERTIELSEQTQRAKQEYEQARDDHDRDRLRRRYDDFRRRYVEAETNLDRERIRAIADAADVRPRRVRRMREDGMGWGQIAKALDVHPSVVGKGHHKGKHADKKKHHTDKDYRDDDRHHDKKSRDDKHRSRDRDHHDDDDSEHDEHLKHGKKGHKKGGKHD